jgi:acyl carrier protein
MTDPIAILARLAPAERTRILDRLRAERNLSAANGNAHAVRTADRDAPLPASFWQEQMWFLDQLSPGAANYNAPFSFELDGPLAPETLRSALAEISNRHEILRTTLCNRDGRICQVIAPPQDFRLAYLDLSGDPDPAAAAERHAVSLAQTPIGLKKFPLYRTLLLRLDRAGNHHVLIWVASHAIADGWSVGVMVRELCALYPRLLRGERVELWPLALQFADHSAAQRSRMSGAYLQRLIAFWRRRLSDVAPLRFPFDFAAPALPTFRAATCAFELPAPLCAKLIWLGRAMDVTPFVTLLSAYKLLLSLYTGQSDIAVGTATAGRTRPELEPLIGPFQNTVGLRTDLSGDPTFQELCKRVQNETLDAFAHQDLPFGKIVEILRPDRNGGRNPIWQTFFLYGSLPDVDLDVRVTPELRMRCAGIPNQTVKFDFELTIEQRAGSFVGRFDYSADLIDRDTATAFCEQYRLLLEQAADDCNKRISEFATTPGGAPSRANSAARQVALPSNTSRPEDSSQDGELPPDVIESVLIEMWKESLGVERVMVHDDFFASGGHSLLAAQLVMRIGKKFSVNLTLRDFLQSCTVAGLAQTIRRGCGGANGVSALSILERVERMSDAEITDLLGDGTRTGRPSA